MAGSTLVRLRAVLRNALAWGAGWSALGFALFTGLRLTGVVHGPWIGGVGLAVKTGFIGAIAGGAFSAIITFAYRGRRLSDISWIRFGIAGGIIAGVFIPTFLEMMNFLSGTGFIPLRLVLDDAVLSAVFGGAIAAASIKIAQRGTGLPPGEDTERDRIGSADRSSPEGEPKGR